MKGVGERLERERTCVYTWLIHDVVWQKRITHCKAIIFQLKKRKEKSDHSLTGACS